MAFNLLMPDDFTHQGQVSGKYWMHVDGLTATDKLVNKSIVAAYAVNFNHAPIHLTALYFCLHDN